MEAAAAAERGGADRIELCRGLACGGLTPDDHLIRTVRAEVRLRIFAMIRPRGGDFVYSHTEFAAMQRDIKAVRQLGIDGVVLGMLTADDAVDVERTSELVELARPVPVTFHRAFDICAGSRDCLEQVIRTGAARILTSGGASTASEGLTALITLVEAAAERIIIVPGGGISARNILHVAQQTRAHEFHSGLSSVLDAADRHGNRFEAEVRGMAEQLRNTTGR